ncbi:nucleoporin p58/p45 isoform X2, partial [Sigmodon hispidus]
SGFSFGTGSSSTPSVGLNFGTLRSTATPASTSASAGCHGAHSRRNKFRDTSYDICIYNRLQFRIQ